MAAYQLGRNKIFLMGEVLEIRRPNFSETWAGSFPFILRIRDSDNEKDKNVLWRGPDDPYVFLVYLTPVALEC